jgi:hypothetical protein
MLPKRVQVIKQNQIEVSGTVRLAPAVGVSPMMSRMSSHTPGMGAPGAAQQARIIESNSEYAILEITCSCGCKSHIQCNYGNV